MERFLTKFLTFWMPVSRARKVLIRHKLRSWLIRKNVEKNAKIGKNVRFERHCIFTKGSEVGDYTGVDEITVFGRGKIKIGRYCRLSWGLRVHTSNHDYNGETIPFGEGNIIKDVEIGDFVWIGSDVMLLPGTKIGEGSIVQGGSVVHGVIPPCSILGGNPAKVFATRDVEKFNQLKAEGKFKTHEPGW